MIEKPPKVEREPDEIPSEEEITNLFEKLKRGEEYVEGRRQEDEKGVYLWEISKTDESGGVTEYSYMRAGQYPEGSASESAVHVAFYDADGMPVGGESIAKYRNGEWVDSE